VDSSAFAERLVVRGSGVIEAAPIMEDDNAVTTDLFFFPRMCGHVTHRTLVAVLPAKAVGTKRASRRHNQGDVAPLGIYTGTNRR
jgi:hypothetical protein